MIVVGCALAYLVLGALYARTQATAIDRRVEYEYQRDKETRKEIGKRTIGWPVMAVVDFARGPAYAWTTSPVTNRLNKIKQLRREAAAWQEQLNKGTEGEREMAAVIIQSLTEQANELRRALGRRYDY